MKKPVIALLHLGYWIMFCLLLLLFYGFIVMNNEIPSNPVFWYYLFLSFGLVPAIISFYTSYTVLFKLLNRKKILLLFIAGIGVAAAAALIGALILSLVFGRHFMFADGYASFFSETITMAFGALINGVTGLVMKGFITWYGDIRLKEELSKKNYEMELALIKAQINPHFLFNTINNIDVLIQKDADKASAYLNKLSDMMRFMLYETKTEKIPLAKELDYIEKYIDLQKIRTSNPDYVKYAVKGELNGLMTEPMLYIPFIENAFKHAENKKIENAVRIDFDIEKGRISFECENSYSPHSQEKPGHSGLGNDLIERRLRLLYPGKHKLEVTNSNETYKVKLVLYMQ